MVTCLESFVECNSRFAIGWYGYLLLKHFWFKPSVPSHIILSICSIIATHPSYGYGKPNIKVLYPCIKFYSIIRLPFEEKFEESMWIVLSFHFLIIVKIKGRDSRIKEKTSIYLQKSWIGSWCQISIASSRGHCHLFYRAYNLYLLLIRTLAILEECF